ncbi:MAG: hypothetical protein ABII18_01210 [bacterium]|nr:hypothetical protein [bacterium]MBU1918348.1 hypothetical protein [bacterium]
MSDAFVIHTEHTSCADSLGAQLGLIECDSNQSVPLEPPAYKQIGITSHGEALIQQSLAYEQALPLTANTAPQLQCSGSICTDCHVHGWATVSWEESVHHLNTCHYCHHPPLGVLMNSGLKTMNIEWFEETTTPQNPDEITKPWVDNHYCEKCHTTEGMDEGMAGISDDERWGITKIDQPRLEHGVETLHDFHFQVGDLHQYDWIPKESFEYWDTFHRDHHGNESHESEAPAHDVHDASVIVDSHGSHEEMGAHDATLIGGAECMHCHGRPVHQFKADAEVCYTCHGDDLSKVHHNSENQEIDDALLKGENNCMVCHGAQFMGEQPENDWPGERPWYKRLWWWFWGS